MAQKSYQTRSKMVILEYFEKHTYTTVTANDLYQYFCENKIPIDRSTIYRSLDRMLKENLLLKFTTDDGKKSTYQYIDAHTHCENHLHLKCISCGKIIHLDCAFMGEISNHILSKHDFHLQCESSIIYGLCKECKDKQ